MDELRKNLLHEIMVIYGPNQGQSIGAVIIPAFLSVMLSLLRLHPGTEYQTLVDYDGYSISSKVFLPTVVDIMVI